MNLIKHDRRTIREHISEAFQALAHWLTTMLFQTLFAVALSTCAISSALAQQHDTLPQQNQLGDINARPIDPAEVRAWLEHLNDAHASDISIENTSTARHPRDDRAPIRNSSWIPLAFLITVLICGGLTATRMPMVWKKGIAYHRPEQRTVSLGAKIDSAVGCFFAMIVGLLAIPLLLATLVALLACTVRALTTA